MSINFILPGFYEHFKLYKAILNLWETSRHWFYPDINIGAVYGNFQFCTWDGGRIFSEYSSTSKEDILMIRDFFNSKSIPLRFIFTNPILAEKDFYDRFNNTVLSLCENPLNEIVVNNPKLEEYIKTNYPSYKKYISSTTKCLTKTEDSFAELQKDYYMVCLDYNLNKNFNFLSQIPEEIKPKVEFLSNAICGPGCPNRKEHYRLNGISHLKCGEPYQIDKCYIEEGIVAKKTREYKNTISPEEIYNQYSKMGFQNFKLEGRTLPDYTVGIAISNYIVKPEYKDEFLDTILDFLNQKI